MTILNIYVFTAGFAASETAVAERLYRAREKQCRDALLTEPRMQMDEPESGEG